MLDWKLFWLLVGISIPGIIITIPGTFRTIEGLINKDTSGRKKPDKTVLLLLSFVQSFILVIIASAVGTKLTTIIGFEAPFFRAVLEQGAVWNSFYNQLLPSLFYGLFGAVVFLSLYYYYYRPRLDKDTVINMEELRNNIGIWGRIFYGGIVEEILTRWGMLTLFIWLFKLIFNTINFLTIWASILISGILFALGHLPSYLGAGCKKTPMFLSLMITLNLLASLIFGWLFWHYGLLAAMLAHSIFHIVWYPFDLHFKRLREEEFVIYENKK